MIGYKIIKYHFLLIFLSLAIFLFPAGAARAGDGADPPESLFYPSRLETKNGALLSPSLFSPSVVCAGCHTEIYYQWNGSMHSRAHEDPLYMNISKLASRETGGLTDRFCAGCHSPIAVASGEVPPVGNPGMSRIGAEGLTCDFCHTIDKGMGVGNLPALMDPGPVKRGPRKDSKSPFHETAFLELSTQAEFCGLCHEVSHPLNNLPIEQTYSEWKEGPYNSPDPEKRVYCQDCHMKQRPGMASTGLSPAPDYPAKSAIMGPKRKNLYSHYFIGANTAMTAMLGSTVHSKMAGERLRAAATLEVRETIIDKGRLDFQIRITNAGAGHYLPTGLTEARQMWLEVTVFVEDGPVLYRSGYLDEKGNLEPETLIFHTILGDSEGKPTEKVWEADRILLDRRIPPKDHVDVPYSLKLKVGREEQPVIRARLLYRSYPPELARTASIAEASPPVEMAVIEKQLAGNP